MTSGARKTKAVLFDVDGTICDTNYIHVTCWHKALIEAENETVPMSKLHALMGIGSDQLTTKAIGRHSNAASEMHSKFYEEHWDDITVFDGHRELFENLAKQGLKLVLASSADGSELEMLRKKINSDDLLEGSTNSDDVESSKPEPDIFAEALKTAGVTSSEAVVVGDTVWDMLAAKKACIDAVGVLTGGRSREELLQAGAKEIFEDLKDLNSRLDELINR